LERVLRHGFEDSGIPVLVAEGGRPPGHF
jgi:hypothetical protein